MITEKEINEIVSYYYGISAENVKFNRFARRTAMYITKETTPLSLREIANIYKCSTSCVASNINGISRCDNDKFRNNLLIVNEVINDINAKYSLQIKTV